MRKIRLLAAVLVLFSWSRPALAHQLDEYLQAARIAIESDRIVLEINLTPGVAVAENVFASIDRDGDRAVSRSEIEAYGRKVVRDVTLEVDGDPLALTLVRAESPAWPEMRDGLGTLRLQATAETAITGGRHRLRFTNRHRSDIGVYLVNALKPASGRISIVEQRRDVHQRGIQVEFDRASWDATTPWIVFPLLGLTGALALRGRRHTELRACENSAGGLCSAGLQACPRPPGQP